jgi:D-glycero-alpha-D-manno-heptose 1-phosphate guanylyltransferase
LQALILSGGLGTRLQSVVKDTPKTLALVAGKPFLYWLIIYLQKNNISDFIFSLGYLHEQVEAFLNNEFPTLNYVTVIEDEPMGTGGAIKLCLPFCKNDEILLVNGDTFFDLDIQAFQADFLASNADGSIALTPMQHFDRYGAVSITTDNIITEFNEKKYCDFGLINTGIVLFKTAVFNDKIENLPPKFSFEKDFIEPNILDIKITGYIASGYFIDIGIPEDYNKAQTEIAQLII